MQDLEGRTAIVTGASRGIGPFIARALCDEGMNVALVARTAGALEELASQLGAAGSRAIAVPADLGDRASLDRIVDATISNFGTIDVLVNNAALISTARFSRQAEEEIDEMIAVNLSAGLLLTRRVLPGMIERGRGHVVMLSSLAGKVGSPYEAVYASTKAGQIGFVQSLRAELDGTGVSASAVCPGFVTEAGMWEDASGPAGVRAPRLVGATTPMAVAKATVRAIRADVPELFVNRPPMRPTIALGEVSPRLRYWLLRRLGVNRTFQRVVEHYEMLDERSAAQSDS
jgi:short-subunit dehydrogenase